LAVDLPSAAEQILAHPTSSTRLYYLVRDPSGKADRRRCGDIRLARRANARRTARFSYDATYRGTKVRAAALLAPCGGQVCTITGRRDERASATAWCAKILFGQRHAPGAARGADARAGCGSVVARGLAPLEGSRERSQAFPRDLRSIEPALAPADTRPLIEAMKPAAVAGRRNRTCNSNASSPTRAPVAHAASRDCVSHMPKLALAQPLSRRPAPEIEQVHSATVRIAAAGEPAAGLVRARARGRVRAAFAVT